VRGPARILLLASLASAISAGCATPSPTPSPTLVPTPSPTASPTPTPTPEPTPTPIPIDQAMLARRLTVLVVGADGSAARRAIGHDVVNTDALMLVSVSADKSRVDLISVPRDTVDVPLSNGTIYHGKINGIAQELGIDALVGAMSTLLGVPIDRYVRIDMDDFVWMVDAVGGIDLTLDRAISDPKVHLKLPAGPNHLDGGLALAFSRTRFDSDYGRAARQQVVVMLLVRKWLHPGPAALLAAAFQLGSLQTNIRPDELPTLLEIGLRSTSASVVAAVLQPPRYSRFAGIEPNSRRGWVIIPNVAEMRRYTKAALAN
jgi:LCP family protein required for cell wall assembly